MWRALIILCLIPLSACTVLGDRQLVRDPVFDKQFSAILQETLEMAARIQKADGISASLYISDLCHWQGTTGKTKPDPGVPVESDMLFGFGSITKTFIAAIVLQLAEENKLELDDRLGKWVDEYNNIDAGKTIRQLLNHGSGLYNFTDNESFWSDIDASPDRIWSPEDILKYVKPPPSLGFDAPKYSNTNYILLGMIIEAASGNSLEWELQNRIIEPLHLERTYLAKNDFNPERWANSTALFSSLYSGVWAAGAIASTSSDIAKWTHALHSGSFLQAASQESMLDMKTRRTGYGGVLPMGLGVLELRIGWELAWGHGGWLGHFVSRTFYLPKYELSVAYSSSGADVSLQLVPGSQLVRTYIDNKPDDISMCFDS